jgi:ABC-2 type transport system ATP-binding protein
MAPASRAPKLTDAARAELDRISHGPALLDVNDLGVRYDVRLQRERTLRASLASAIRRPASQPLWGIRHVSFRLAPGECLAVVGPNGAGKSTLLQVLAGVMSADEGSVERRGAISALLNLGVGFDLRLTGRENVELVAALFGLSRGETRARMETVIDFSEMREFFDLPLRTYSSGMRARLGFAVATMIDPQILVLDEVIGTGDAAFRAKSRERVAELVRTARGVVLASHDMKWVGEFANFAMLLDRGRVLADGAPLAIAEFHRSRSARPARPYDCPVCGERPIAGFCPYCGLRRYWSAEAAHQQNTARLSPEAGMESVRLFLADADLAGWTTSGGQPMIDILQRGMPIAFQPASVGAAERIEVPPEDILLVVPSSQIGLNGDGPQRKRRQVLLRVGPYMVTGTAHLSDDDQQAPAWAIRPFLPLTKATLSRDGQPAESLPSVLVNLDRSDEFHNL